MKTEAKRVVTIEVGRPRHYACSISWVNNSWVSTTCGDTAEKTFEPRLVTCKRCLALLAKAGIKSSDSVQVLKLEISGGKDTLYAACRTTRTSRGAT